MSPPVAGRHRVLIPFHPGFGESGGSPVWGNHSPAQMIARKLAAGARNQIAFWG
jgi:hypothetical protein